MANLIHPIPVTIETWDPSQQTMDDAAREPIHGARGGTDVVIPAQVKWNKKSSPQYTAGGVVQQSEGYLLVRRADMRARNVVFKRGDKIKQIGAGGNQDALLNPLYITGEVPMAHMPGARGSELVRYMFEDRNPGATP